MHMQRMNFLEVRHMGRISEQLRKAISNMPKRIQDHKPNGTCLEVLFRFQAGTEIVKVGRPAIEFANFAIAALEELDLGLAFHATS